MRSVGWVPNPIGMTGILLRGHKDTDTEGEGQVKTASETGERQLQAKDCQVLLTALRNREEARRRSPLQDSEGAQPRQHLDFELLAVRQGRLVCYSPTVKRGHKESDTTQ